jgi:hypothetical protein
MGGGIGGGIGFFISVFGFIGLLKLLLFKPFII